MDYGHESSPADLFLSSAPALLDSRLRKPTNAIVFTRYHREARIMRCQPVRPTACLPADERGSKQANRGAGLGLSYPLSLSLLVSRHRCRYRLHSSRRGDPSPALLTQRGEKYVFNVRTALTLSGGDFSYSSSFAKRASRRMRNRASEQPTLDDHRLERPALGTSDFAQFEVANFIFSSYPSNTLQIAARRTNDGTRRDETRRDAQRASKHKTNRV